MEIRINIRADIVKVDAGTGIVTLAIEAAPMERDLEIALHKTFPHCMQEIEQLCEKEALINAVTSEGSKDSPRKN